MGDAIDFIAPGFGDPMSLLDPIGTPLANMIGLNSPADYAFSAPWDYPSMMKDDWRVIKHLLVPDMRRDREAMINSADTPRRIVFGTVKVSGQLTYPCTNGGSFETLHMIVTLSGHPVTGYTQIYLDDKLITDPVFSGCAAYEFYDGNQTTACASMVAAAGGLWTSSHVLNGCSYIYLRLTYNEDAFLSGLPIPKVVLQGAKIYDPRTTTTYFSDNPALCAYHYMMSPVTAGGMGCEVGEVDVASIIEAANYCDELVDTPTGTEKRYTCNGVLNIDSTPASMLVQILNCMDATPLYSQGTWKINIGKPYAGEILTIDESWLNGAIGFKAGSNKNNLINTAKGTWINPADHYAQTDFPIVQIADYVSEDQEELTTDLQLGFTNSQYMAQRLGRIAIERSRNATSISHPCNLKALRLQPNICVYLNNTIMGWENLLCRVENVSIAPTGGISLQLTVENEAIYDINPDDLASLPVPDLTNLPDPWTISTPTNLILSETLKALSVGVGYTTQVDLSWYQSDANVSKYQIYIDGLYAGQSNTTSISLMDVSEGVHTFSVVAYNSLGSKSAPATKTTAILGKTAPPANVINLRASATSYGGLILSWDAVADVDLLNYSVRFSNNPASAWENALDMGTAFSTTLTIPAALDGIYLVKAIDTGLRESLVAASVITTIPSLANYNAIAVADDGATWPGSKTSCYELDGKLYLDMAGLVDDLADWDAWANIDTYGGARPEGYYAMAEQVDLGTVQTSRCAVQVEYAAVDTSSLFDSVQDFDAVANFDGSVVPGVSVQPQIRTSLDGSNWGDWMPFVAGDYTAMSLQFRLKLATTIPTNVPQVSSFAVAVDMPDRAERGQGVAIASGGTPINFSTPYMVPPIVRTTIIGATSGDTEKITNITTSGFTMQILNTGSGVARTIDWQSVGY